MVFGYYEDKSAGGSFRREPINFHYLDREEYLQSHPDAKKSDFVQYKNQKAAEKRMYSGTTLSEGECKRILDEKEQHREEKAIGVGNEGQLFDHIYAGKAGTLDADYLIPAKNEELRQVIVQPGDGSHSDHLAVIGFFAVGEAAKKKEQELSATLASMEPGTAFLNC